MQFSDAINDVSLCSELWLNTEVHNWSKGREQVTMGHSSTNETSIPHLHSPVSQCIASEAHPCTQQTQADTLHADMPTYSLHTAKIAHTGAHPHLHNAHTCYTHSDTLQPHLSHTHRYSVYLGREMHSHKAMVRCITYTNSVPCLH